VVGLFQGMFEKNMLTFNLGWDDNAQKLDTFADVRELPFLVTRRILLSVASIHTKEPHETQ
jgi:hypothetical protein